MKYASLISLGCAKNLVDSEEMVMQLLNLGYSMTEEAAEADLIVVNTCGFLQSAVQEAVEVILAAAGHKIAGKCRILAAAGCMVQRYGKKLLSLLPEVDLFLGASHYHALGAAVESKLAGNPRRLWIGRPALPPGIGAGRVVSTGPHSAYLKIAEGCGNSCSFCLIPHLRGPLRSRQAEDIHSEAARLAADGIKEINLIAQDTTAFGLDRNEPEALPKLLEKLDALPGLLWIRLLYSHPDRITDRLLQTMANSRKIVPYLDIPIQHCAPALLAAMDRPVSSFQRILDKIRSTVPGVAIRTSIMVGFPGETRARFRSLLAFMERARFDHAGVFVYSAEAGTRAARLPGRPGKRTAESRRDVLLELQRDISRRKLKLLVGRTLPVLIEGPHPESDLLISGRLPTQAPEVDGRVIVTEGHAQAGHLCQVSVTASHDYDLEGVIRKKS
ncbi:MAG TPA: 30S ribosomal protein S12 methylthiotransferase RimO [Syntrophobacteraceae bacterium]|nr:30S ribosomal protein S12 methylthiotransferase RimO [Syntrophobacteraceae bacterium]